MLLHQPWAWPQSSADITGQANCFMGRSGLINSGGESKGKNDLVVALETAVINKRAGGMSLRLGRKAFQRPFEEGVYILNSIQDVYLNQKITIA